MADLLANSLSQLSDNAVSLLTSLVTVPPALKTLVGEDPVTEKIIADVQRRISRPQMSVRYNGSGNKISPAEALHRLKLAERRRRLKMRMSASSSSQSDKADVVFFPTDGHGGDGGGCQDATAGGGGFNTFSFLAFLLAGFNAISVVSNNNNNRQTSRGGYTQFFWIGCFYPLKSLFSKSYIQRES